LGQQLKNAALRSMGMSFFVSCPISNALADPHKSGHQPTSRIIVKSTLHVRADLWGHADAPYLLRAWSKKRHTHAP
ncbi:MAG: hypothetical protein J7K02_04270, partial [Deltaproteobacteria bacterium]|nr:hypothetical protein [Deltaproteobacteria bacterium]